MYPTLSHKTLLVQIMCPLLVVSQIIILLTKHFDLVAEQTEARGLGSKIYEGIDYFLVRGLTIGLWDAIVGETTTAGTSVFEAMSTMSESEFRVFIREFYKSKIAEGIITVENLNGLYKGLEDATKLGIDLDDDGARILALIDIATLGGGAA